MNDGAADLRSEEQILGEARMRLANKRSATEWFEVFQEVVESGVSKTAAGRNDRELIMERMRARRPLYAQVKREFAAIDMKFDEAFELRGMEYDQASGRWSMPHGWIEIKLVTRKETVRFTGEKATVAYSFFVFWHRFKDTIDPMALDGKKMRLIDR